MERIYLCIDLKSFYASVECVERGLDPMTARLVVADPERSKKTICLAISPAMKALGIKNRCRVFQIPEKIKYIMASPRMKRYIDYSADIYEIYLKYIAKEDIHVYSIDEAFLDVTDYLPLYQTNARDLALKIMEDIKKTTGITAAAGIGTNLYLAKVALDITAKHAKDNIGYLDEYTYRNTLWEYKPLTDFWRIGNGLAKRLSAVGIRTMRDITQADEEMLYCMFVIDAELLIDHAWGKESTTINDIKAYKTKSNSLSNGQVLARDYSFEECRLIVKEMTDLLCLEMAEKGVATQSVSLMIGYSNEIAIASDSGSVSLPTMTNCYRTMIVHIMKLYEDIVQRDKPIRRLNISCNNILPAIYEQYNLFTDYTMLERDRKIQKA